MADRVIYKGGKTVTNAVGNIKLVLPTNGTMHKFPRWWKKKHGAYIDCAIFNVTLENGVVVRLVVPAVERMHLEIRHDGYGNFTFPVSRVDRIAVVAIDSPELLVEYQFSKISGGKVLKRIVAGIPSPTAPEPQPAPEPEPIVEVEAEEAPKIQVQVHPSHPKVDLEKMTKKQLLDWSLEQGHDLVNNHSKAELLSECQEILDNL
tara:strand:+ start:497 stop:1111 length:615 start_codon:yes stop_codon:yes gene_type:complete